MKDLAASVNESCYFQRKERCGDRDLMAVAKEEYVALTKGESQRLTGRSPARAKYIIYHIHTYSTLKEEKKKTSR
jgi:hypothetical protein